MKRTIVCLFLLAACTPHPLSPPSSPIGLKPVPVNQAALTDLDGELFGTLVIASPATLMTQLGDQNAGTLEKMLTSVGISPKVSALIDFDRPLGMALLNPTLLASPTVRPILAMIPLRSGSAFAAALEAAGAQKTQWGYRVPTMAGEISIGIQREGSGDHALIAWRSELLPEVAHVLGPKLRGPKESAVTVHMNLDNARAVLGSQLDALGQHVALLSAEGSSPSDPQIAFSMREILALIGYAHGVSDVELLADVDSGGVTVTARLDSNHGSDLFAGPGFDRASERSFRSYVEQQRTGPAWGSRLLPRDSALAYMTRMSPLGRRGDVNASMAFLASATARPIAAEEAMKWRRALDRVSHAMAEGGELSYAVWPAQGKGGLGFGGAFHVDDSTEARAAVKAAYEALAVPIGAIVTRSLALDPVRYDKRIEVRERTRQIAGQSVELVEVSVRWPSDAGDERRVFESMFGEKLVVATAFVGDSALFAMGADYESRLTTMSQAALGGPAASLQDNTAFQEALGYHDQSRISLAFLEMPKIAALAGALFARSTDLTDDQRGALIQLLGDVRSGAIISTTNVVQGQARARYELTSHLPRTALEGRLRLAGALWRIALAPVINPPVLPPLPLPPSQITPSAGFSDTGPTM